MRLLMLCHDTHETSGWGRMLVQISNELRKLGVSVSIAAEDGVSKDLKLSPVHSWIAIIQSILVARRAAKGVDVVHALDVWPYALYGYFAVLGTKRRLIIQGVGTYSAAPLHTSKLLLLRFAMRRAHKIFAISNFTLKKMNDAFPLGDKGIVIPLGVTGLTEPTEESIAQMRTSRSIFGSPVILTVGEVKERKGQYDTLRAVEALIPKYPGIQYVLVGAAGGDYARQIRSYIESNDLEKYVRILDDISTDLELSSLYAIADVFALNSRNDEINHHFEGFGLVILEGYQFGIPAVGSSGCGIEDAIVEGETGYLVQQGNIEAIASALDKALLNRADLQKGIRTFRSKFSWRKTAESYLSWYKDVS